MTSDGQVPTNTTYVGEFSGVRVWQTTSEVPHELVADLLATKPGGRAAARRARMTRKRRRGWA